VGRSYCVEAIYEPPPAPTSSSALSTSIQSSTSIASTSSKPRPSVATSSTLRTTFSTKPPPTTTTPGKGISTPFPLQPNIATNCDKFYFVKRGEKCEAIAKANDISTAQFVSWNPSASLKCTGLWADAYACVSIIGHEPSPSLTTTKPGNVIATPTPILSGMVANCDSFYEVRVGVTCDKISELASVASASIILWNPSAGSACTGLWADYVSLFHCLHVPR
jgi:hypothetical protein